MRRTPRWPNMWARHVSAKRTVVEAYEQLIRKGIIAADPCQRRMAEACTPLLQLIEQSHANEPVSSSSPRVTCTAYGCDDPYLRQRAWLSAVPSSVWSAAVHHAGRLFPDSVTRTLGLLEAENLGRAEKRGLYLWGDVGIGKTMILDLFDLCATPYAKRRSHLHSFMTEVEGRLFRAEVELTERRRRPAASLTPMERRAVHRLRPIDIVVEEVLQETPILCFDEFQTFDVAHAALLAAFFTAAFRLGLFLLTTSNRHPSDLCHVSSSFNAFLPILYQHCTIVHASGIRDYRSKSAEESFHQLVFLHPNSKSTMERLVRRVERGYCMRNADRDTEGGRCAVEWVREDVLWHHGRSVLIPLRCGGCALFDFSDICGPREGYSSADMQLIASHFHTVLVTNVPQISRGNFNASHQFVVLVDELYQNSVKLLFTSTVPWNHLMDSAYETQDAHALTDGGEGGTSSDGRRPFHHHRTRNTISSLDDAYYSEGEDDRSGYTAHYNFRNEEEVMSFARIRSRLNEMGSATYLLRDHRHFVVSDFDFTALVEPDIQPKVCA